MDENAFGDAEAPPPDPSPEPQESGPLPGGKAPLPPASTNNAMDASLVDEWKRWAFAQIDNGCAPEDLTLELVASGFDEAAAAGIVDEVNRRAEAIWTRSALARGSSAVFASRGRTPASIGRMGIVGGLANAITWLFRLVFQDPEEDLLPRKKSAPVDSNEETRKK